MAALVFNNALQLECGALASLLRSDPEGSQLHVG